MSDAVQVASEAHAIVVRIPLKMQKRGGRKLIVATEPPPARAQGKKTDDTILKALGRAYRWKRMLESGEFSSISDLATAEKINHSYVRRILRLTLLSPNITETILEARLAEALQLEDLLRRLPDDWRAQAPQV